MSILQPAGRELTRRTWNGTTRDSRRGARRSAGLIFGIAWCGSIGLSWVAATGADMDRPVARARYLMGTRLSIEAAGGGAREAIDAAFDEVARLEQVMSNWRATSELTRLNAAAARAPFVASPDLLTAVQTALRWAAMTGGAFDPTVEALVRRLGLRGASDTAPRKAGSAGTRAADAVGWNLVAVDEQAGSIRFEAEGIGIDLGGIGKGIALDAAARVLRGRGVSESLLDFGGQVLAIGSGPDANGWPVGIADPRDRERAVGMVNLRGGSLATSGNGERTIDRNGTTIGHILDPAGGRPADFRGSVSVLAGEGAAADALSTALFVMGPEQGLEWAEERGIATIFYWWNLDGDLTCRATSAMESHLAGGHAAPGCASAK